MANKKELDAILSRTKKWAADQGQYPGAGNKTHYSPTDSDARISVKPGKARKLNSPPLQPSVDTAHHVVTDIRAYHADGKDSQQLPDIVRKLSQRL